MGVEFPSRNVGPASRGDVVDQKSALSKEFLDVTVRQ
jgi:hypothetical protein